MPQFKYTITNFRTTPDGKRTFCIIRDKVTRSELFRSGESKNRSDVVCEMNQYLQKNPYLINYVEG